MRLRRAFLVAVTGAVLGAILGAPAVEAVRYLPSAVARQRYLESTSVQTRTGTATGDVTAVTVPCPSGRLALSGGADSPGTPGIYVIDSYPSGSPATAWVVEVIVSQGGATSPFTAYAVCSR